MFWLNILMETSIESESFEPSLAFLHQQQTGYCLFSVLFLVVQNLPATCLTLWRPAGFGDFRKKNT